ncbi:hypothetical protein [Candidatus Pollutiaquabacter sp.]|uniref:hypothetical protein n=1 Tax=Candidatus Pollutiaquabacter sp. TaxID=3416354 RepID=UPI003CABA02D|nr:hypothetical protein [Bacteroidota bacterium]
MNIVIGIIAAFFILKEYKSIGPGHVLAKSIHFIVTIATLVIHADVFTIIGKLISDKNKTIAIWRDNLSLLDGNVFVINNIVYIPISLLLMSYGIGLIYRFDKARIYFSKLTLWLIPVTTITIYMLAKKDSNLNSAQYFAIGLVASALIYGTVSYIYRSSLMKEFFKV